MSAKQRSSRAVSWGEAEGRRGRGARVSPRGGFGAFLTGAGLVAASVMVGSECYALEPFPWPGDHPPIVPSWAPPGVIAVLDRDRDGLLDAYENALAQAFVPAYWLSTMDRVPFNQLDEYHPDLDPVARLLGLHDEPVVLHKVTAYAVGPDGSVLLHMRFIKLYTADGGYYDGWSWDHEYGSGGICAKGSIAGPCGQDMWWHNGDNEFLHLTAVLDPATNLTTLTDNAGYSEWPDSNGRLVNFETYGKHHNRDSPYDFDACDGAPGRGQHVVPELFGSQVGSFCEGTWTPALHPDEYCNPVEHCCDTKYYGWHCVASFDIFAPKTPNGLLNSLELPPYGYPGESVYNPEHFTGGLGGPDHRVDPLVDLAYYPFADRDVPLIRVDLGGPSCGPVVFETVADWDQDGVPDGCDPCVSSAHPDVPVWSGGEFVGLRDLDGDGVTDGCDVCPGHDDRVNTNLDGEEVNGKAHMPDGCDSYATARIERAAALEPFAETSFSGSTAIDTSAGLIDIDITTNQQPTPEQAAHGQTLEGEMTARRCFCVSPNGTLVDDARCLARDVPGDPPPLGSVCIKDGVGAPVANVDNGLGWLPFRSLRRPVGAPVPPEELDLAACDARRVGGLLEACSRSIVTYAPGTPATDEEEWARRPGLTWDAWSEITNREVIGDTDVPAIPDSDALRTPGPSFVGNWPGWLTTESSNAPCEKGEVCLETGCRTFPTPLGIGYSCIEGALPFGAEGPGGFWTRLEALSDAGPDFADTATWRRIHDGYLGSRIQIRSGRTSSGFHKFPILAHRFLAPWIPIERFAPLELTAVLGGTPAVFNVGGVARLALFPVGEADSVGETPLGDAEPFVRTATALALASVSPGGETAPGTARLDRAELWAFDGGTGVLRRLVGGLGGFSVVEELATGLVAERAELAVTPRGEGFLAVAGSPWRFFRIAGAAGAASAAIAPLDVPGTWEGSLALLPSAGGVRAVGVMSAGIFDKTVAWASLREGTSDVHFLPFVPVREGLWFGYGVDAGRPVVLVGGGSDARGGAHSDVYAVDLEAGGDTVLVATDGGAGGPGIGPHAWVTGRRDAGGESGWALRVVPARTTPDGSVRYSAYERHPESRHDVGWAAAGGSAHDSPRGDATLAHALAEGTSCELDGAPWYAWPGTWRYDDDPTHAVLRCAQAVPPSPAVSLLPRQVSAYALGERALWTVSQGGLERWRLEGGSPQRVQQLPLSLPGKPNARRALAASDKLVATSRGERLAVFAPFAAGDGSFGAVGTLELEDEVVALFAGAKDIWAVGRRRVTHLRVRDGAVTVVGIFELVRYEGDLFARRASHGDGDEGDDDHEHGHEHGHGHEHEHDDSEHHGDDDLEIVGASLRGPILAVALEHELVTLDLREPERLPTFGSRHFDEKVKDVATDGRFVYLRTSGDEPDGRWHTFRATARSALEPAGNAPARSFAKSRQYAGRYAARLTGVALHVGVGSTP